VGGHGCGQGGGHAFGLHSGFWHDLGAACSFLTAVLAFGAWTSTCWPNTEVATRNDATIHGLGFFSIFSIFCSPFWTNSFVFLAFAKNFP
ncbi:MAG TPA: hypothetical protein VLF94_01335, partial [Chlamydiales bacterium]|nr:hypothetical protein [Chlamydiales bacterium]